MKDHPLSIRARSAILAGIAAALCVASIGLWLDRGELRFLLSAAVCLLALLAMLKIFVRQGDGK